jgi:hypothetical protein
VRLVAWGDGKGTMDTMSSMTTSDDPFSLDDEFGVPETVAAQHPTPAAPAAVTPATELADEPPDERTAPVVQTQLRVVSADVDEVTAEPAATRGGDGGGFGFSGSELLTPTQRHTFDSLLAVGADRPTARTGLADELAQHIVEGTAAALETWTEPSMWFGKSQLTTAVRCEGAIAAERQEAPGRSKLHPATAAGIVTHRAIQIAHTHPGRTPAATVAEAILASLDEASFAQWWEDASVGVQSDLTTASISRLIAFLDSWPPLDDRWAWRFEESMQARIGRLTLGTRVDLVLGRPRADGRQTMLLCDMKTSGISEHHDLEAGFYALVCTLRHGVAPWRSCVYSLSGAEWSDPDITAERLMGVADAVIAGVNSTVAVLTETREPVLTGGSWCRWCPAAQTCPAAETDT